MKDYLYDGSFEGMLTCVYYNYHRESVCGIFRQDKYQIDLMRQYVMQRTEKEKAEIVYKAIASKISVYDLRRVYRAYKAEDETKEKKILEYLILGFSIGKTVSLIHGSPTVSALEDLERKVSNEVHRMKGLVRFNSLQNRIFYSPIEPENDIVEFLASHFCDRFCGESFLIHDVGRGKALVAKDGRWFVSDLAAEKGRRLVKDGEEREYSEMWKQYFKTISINERKNSKCQTSCMPLKYRKFLTEMEPLERSHKKLDF